MPSQPTLFDSAPAFDREGLAAKIRNLSRRNIFIGTSSWRYEGWLGQVYTPERYFTRGRFSKRKFHGARAGLDNPTFLDAEAFQAAFLEPLAPYLDRIGVLLIEFGTFSKLNYAEPKAFFDDLDGFLRRLPRDFRYSVEIRNDNFLDAAYFEVLRSNRRRPR